MPADLAALTASNAPSEPIPEPPISRERLRSMRKRSVRASTICVRRLTKREIALERERLEALERDDPVGDIERPRTRGDCIDGPRPCPWVSCRHHLALDVKWNGSIKRNFPDLEVWEMAETCALDVAARGETTLESVGEIMNLTRERIRQLELEGLARLRVRLADSNLDAELAEGRTGGKRRLPMLRLLP